MPRIKKIQKRDGTVVDFDENKIAQAIFKAAQSVGGDDYDMAKDLAAKVVEEANTRLEGTPTVEEIQDLIEDTLIKEGHVKTSKAYIVYRLKRKEQREARKAILGGKLDEESKLSINALQILEARYLIKDEYGRIKETPTQMFRRVANNIAKADKKFGDDPKNSEKVFFDMMSKLEFLPNSPTLMNAGTDIQQLSACFVIPVEDSTTGIFDAIKNAALIHKSGGGCGFSFSRLRPKYSAVYSTHGVASGPVSFMKVFDAATEAIKQGGKRKGANMGVLRVDHPDILEFVNMKLDGQTLQNFNISVAITDDFMKALKSRRNYELIDPATKKEVGELSSRAVFENIVTNAWRRGDPGMIFIDRINKKNTCKHLGEIEATNPCGEMPLLPYESCNLGSINLNACIIDGRFDFEKFRDLVHKGVHFLDNVVEMTEFPMKEIEKMSLSTRKIGLGIMGFADVLYQLQIPYDSEAGVKFAEKLTRFMYNEACKKSNELAKKRGVFPAWKGSIYEKKGIKMRNSSVLSIAPTGTISMIAGCSSGLEPNYALGFVKTVLDGKELLVLNPHFEKAVRDKGLHTDTLMRQVAQVGTVCHGCDELSKDIKRVFVTAFDIKPAWHVTMQAAFQKYVDGAISKTINFPSTATIEEVEKAFLLAYDLGCKGTTIYRHGSMDKQVLNVAGGYGVTTINKRK